MSVPYKYDIAVRALTSVCQTHRTLQHNQHSAVLYQYKPPKSSYSSRPFPVGGIMNKLFCVVLRRRTLATGIKSWYMQLYKVVL